ncbi:metal-dependent hydrolase [Fodinisporobacter ferrooxydans]|uniref:UPF0173 metal-dependent hydrolase LSG31_07765 n=1 Tax=Fodinisporobacter ferrooxydans TaxID=2901836 RepID=A0ABY4CNS2_9BACL|nr:metal-dependent hydrolase [Alicyclobacillaceae bacterium MYW30-H2]
MEILYHGHSCIQVTNNGISFIVDPFLTGNPLAKAKAEDIKVQYVLLTHGHFDHIADAVQIAKQNDATVIATFELASYMGMQGVKNHPMNLGGSYAFEFGKAKMTQAFHSSGFVMEEEQKIIYLGMPGGFLITIGDSTLYHAGDTALFGDMKLIGERHSIDLAFLPIGDNFTMGPDDAVQAAEWIQAKVTVPVHYNTFPPIRQDGAEFVRSLAAKGLQGRALQPGETIIL